MINPKYRQDASPERIVILRALQLGDLLCSVPAFRALRAARPRAEISLIGLPWSKIFVERFRCYLDRFIEFPGYPGLPEREPSIAEIPAFLANAQSEHFDLAIQLQGSGSHVNELTVLLGAREIAGYSLPGEFCPDPARFLAYPEDEPEVWRHLRLMEFLGVPLEGDELEFPLFDQDYRSLEELDTNGELRPGDYVCLHPGARFPSRRWLPERFAAVGDALAARGLRVVLTGTSSEVPVTRAVASGMNSASVDLAGRTSLGVLGALLKGARLVVTNDTGISHVAAGLKVPSVVIFMASDPKRWAPLNQELHRRVIHPINCRPCGYWECPIGHPCGQSVTADEVIAEAEDLLDRALLAAHDPLMRADSTGSNRVDGEPNVSRSVDRVGSGLPGSTTLAASMNLDCREDDRLCAA